MLYLNLVPYTDFQQKNLDWIIKRLGELSDQASTISSLQTRVASLEQRVTLLENWKNVITDNLLPDVGPADNGKILQVVNSVWTAVDLDANNVNY